MSGTGITNDLSMLSNNFGYLTKGVLLGFDKAILDTYIPGSSYGMFRYEKDGGGGSADTLAFLCGQAFGGTTGTADGANTPAANNHQSSFWSMLSEKEDVSGSPDYTISRLHFEPIVDYNYDALGGADDGYFNYAYIGWHNPLYGTSSYYVNSGYGSADNPSHTFMGDYDTGMYRAGAGTIGFATGTDPAMTLTSNASEQAQLIFPGNLVPSSSAATDVQLLDSNNQLIEVSSSRRFKENIVDIELDTTNIYNLRPVTFNPLNDPEKTFGLIAEEVVEYFPELVSLDKSGIPKAVSYSKLPVLLLAEIQKLRKELDELKEKN